MTELDMVQDDLKSNELENLKENSRKTVQVGEESSVKIKLLQDQMGRDIIKMKLDLQRVNNGLTNKINVDLLNIREILEYKLQNINAELHKFIVDSIVVSIERLSQKLEFELKSLSNEISVLKFQKFDLIERQIESVRKMAFQQTKNFRDEFESTDIVDST